jgi:hypothetical protein
MGDLRVAFFVWETPPLGEEQSPHQFSADAPGRQTLPRDARVSRFQLL